MFNKDFYPTPKAIISYMLAGENLNGKTILEPSAGKGDIVDYCIGAGANVLTCELNHDLAKIVASKSKFLKADFLQLQAHEISHIHAIYMNPPFSADEKHILHAWSIAPSGCHIVALCNYQTLANDYSSYRKQLLSLIRDYGKSENLGDVFSEAERKTSIEIGLVHLYKPKTDNDFGDYFESEEDEPEYQSNGIMGYNAVREVVQRYVNACKLYDEVISNGIKMNTLIGEIGGGSLTFTCKQGESETTKASFQKDLQKKAWKWIFGKMNMEKFMTKSLISDINKFVEQQEKVPFTMKNIYKMFELVIGTHGQRMDKVLLEVFEKLTYHYSENRYNVEGWKTNSHYMINKKFILNCVFKPSYSANQIEAVWGSHSNDTLLEDLCKALAYVTASREQIDPLYHFSRKVNMEPNVWYDWGFFEIKGFKKGTAHCKFKDESTWALFNQAVAKAKGFELPENLRKSA
ncbi:MAG: hypothetical protein K0S09_50 [Sphingobacteriaceae bacterium]|jgi:hypothetical protein|nr:hypothetical protein [Sphingobacteriaceae bacterium]